MATVNFNLQADMSYAQIWYGTVYVNDASNIIISNGYRGGWYHGNGFKYSNGAVTGGTLTGYDQGVDVNLYNLTYTLDYSVTGLNLSAKTAASYIQSGNAYGLMQWALSGNDYINGSGSNDILLGFGGNDTINGGSGSDDMRGGLGNDTYKVDSLGDTITESVGQGTDNVLTLLTNFTLPSNVENLSFDGSTNSNLSFLGNTLANVITGSNGNDTLNGNLGLDVLTGGSGSDHFVFNTALNSTSNKDTIKDFVHGTDKIDLSKSVMTALGSIGTLSSADFKLSSQALDLSDRIIYNQSSGALYYDDDGSGAHAAIQIALIGISSHPALTYDDFNII